jgi:hypothetical protein
MDAHKGGVEAQNEALQRVRRPMVAGSYNFDGDQDSDSDHHYSEKSDLDPYPHESDVDPQPCLQHYLY